MIMPVLLLIGTGILPGLLKTVNAQEILPVLASDGEVYIYHDFRLNIGHGFNVYRIINGDEVRLNEAPVYPVNNGVEFRNRIGDLYAGFEESLEVESPQEVFFKLRGDESMSLLLSYSYPEIASALGYLYTDTDPVFEEEITYRYEVVDRRGEPTGRSFEDEFIISPEPVEVPVAYDVSADRHGRNVTINWSFPPTTDSLEDHVIRFEVYMRPEGEDFFTRVTDKTVLRQMNQSRFTYTFSLDTEIQRAEFAVEAVDFTGTNTQASESVDVELSDQTRLSAVHEIYSTVRDNEVVEITWPVSVEPLLAGYHIDRIDQETGERTRLTDELIEAAEPVFRDDMVQEGHTYYYYVIAVSESGVESEDGNPAIQYIETRTPPPSPADLQAHFNEAESIIELSWDEGGQNEQFNTFVILRRQQTDAGWRAFSQVNSGRVTESELTDPGIAGEGFTEGQFYEYGVAAASQSGLRSDTVFTVVQVPNLTPPEPPVGIDTNIDSGVRINVVWGASPSTDVTSYKVYKTDTERDTTVFEMPRNRRLFTDSEVIPGQEYKYFVTAVDSSGNESLPSRKADIMMRDVTPPAPVRNLQAVATEEGVHLRWESVTDDIEGYIVKRSTLSNGVYEIISEELVESVDWVDLEGETGDWYRVYAVDVSGNQSRPGTPRQAVPGR